MKYLKLVVVFLVIVTGCKKEHALPVLSFSEEDRKWFIYQPGQNITLKNASGDSVVYTVTYLRNDFKPEYKDPFTNPTQIGSTEFYQVALKGPTDSISLYFYKELQYSSHPEKMKQTIFWNTMLEQFVELEAIKNQAPFTTRVINGITFNKVTKVIPASTNQTSYPWTRWTAANYDQNTGLIELIDINGVSWLRQ